MEAKLATATEGQPLRCKGMPCHHSWKQNVLCALFYYFFRYFYHMFKVYLLCFI